MILSIPVISVVLARLQQTMWDSAYGRTMHESSAIAIVTDKSNIRGMPSPNIWASLDLQIYGMLPRKFTGCSQDCSVVWFCHSSRLHQWDSEEFLQTSCKSTWANWTINKMHVQMWKVTIEVVWTDWPTVVWPHWWCWKLKWTSQNESPKSPWGRRTGEQFSSKTRKNKVTTAFWLWSILFTH